jgi:membrane protein
MASGIKIFLDVVKQSAIEFADEHVTKLSASLAYYTIFSIGPLLLIIITVLGSIYKKTAVTDQLFDQMSTVTGKPAAAELRSILTNISLQNHSTLFGVIGTVVFIFAATGIFSEIQSSINFIWSIKTKPRRGWLKYLRDRALSLALIIGLGFVMLITIVANLITDMVLRHMEHYFIKVDTGFISFANIALLFVVVSFVFAFIFKVLPDAHIRWKDAIIGGVFTGVLFLIGKFLISYYLGISKSINAYGAATSLILLLSWVYYSALILYFGAEFTEVYAKNYGGGMTPKDSAVHIVKHEMKGTHRRARG